MSVVIFFGLAISPVIVQEASAVTQTVTFDPQLSSIGFTGGFSVAIEWPLTMDCSKGDVGTITYSVHSAPGSFSIKIPLSSITLGLISDQTINVPLSETPIGTYSIPVLQYLTGVPGTIAGVNVDLVGSVSILSITSDSGQNDILTSLSDLKWTSWGSKDLHIQTHNDTKFVQITTRFGYAISIGVSASILYQKITLIAPVQIAAVLESGNHGTGITGVDPFPTVLVIGVIAVVGCVGGGCYWFILRPRGFRLRR